MNVPRFPCMSVSIAGVPSQVLLVEDEFLIRLTLSEVLADEGYTVLEAESAAEALEVLAANPGVAILLTDIQLAGSLDGKALAQRVRASHPALPIIFMTGRPDPDAKPTATEQYVAKPYLPSDICTAVQRMLAGRTSPGA